MPEQEKVASEQSAPTSSSPNREADTVSQNERNDEAKPPQHGETTEEESNSQVSSSDMESSTSDDNFYPRDPGRYARYKREQIRNARNCLLRRGRNGRRPRTNLTHEQDTFLRTVCSMYRHDHTIAEIRDIVGDILSGCGDEYLKQLKTIFPNIVVPSGLLERMKDVYNYLYVRYKRPNVN